MDYIIDSVTDVARHGVQRSWEKFEEFCKSYQVTQLEIFHGIHLNNPNTIKPFKKK